MKTVQLAEKYNPFTCPHCGKGPLLVTMNEVSHMAVESNGDITYHDEISVNCIGVCTNCMEPVYPYLPINRFYASPEECVANTNSEYSKLLYATKMKLSTLEICNF